MVNTLKIVNVFTSACWASVLTKSPRSLVRRRYLKTLTNTNTNDSRLYYRKRTLAPSRVQWCTSNVPHYTVHLATVPALHLDTEVVASRG